MRNAADESKRAKEAEAALPPEIKKRRARLHSMDTFRSTPVPESDTEVEAAKETTSPSP